MPFRLAVSYATNSASGGVQRPRGNEFNEQLIVDLRRILRQAGFAPDGRASTPDEPGHQDNMFRMTHSAGRVRTEGVPAD
jgi:hypothetical protein